MGTCLTCHQLADDLATAKARIAELEEELNTVRRTNPLTGLANKKALAEKLTELQSHADRHNLESYLFFIDLDNFKDINDNHGHKAGDDLLIAVANKLKNCLRAGDMAFHLSGDEFAVVVTGCQSTEAVRQKIVKAIESAEVMTHHHQPIIQTSCSLGVSEVVNSSPQTVIDEAEKVLQDDKAYREGQGLRHKR
ncbi:MAG: hypothetical protein CMF60_01575 [Magnetococcales bacterium]|nr:hypothetical protein [Magnetococcales bacterium]|tara:strand:+ start:66399 stop:66980 length:582 start_codon:yes stop_codon:yes gene_type:complete